MPDPSHPDDPKTIGKPASLFDTDEVRPIQVPPAPVPSPAAASDGYELEGVPFPEVEEPPRPVPIPSPPVERPKPKVKSPTKLSAEAPGLVESGSTEFVTELSEVDPVWTRMREWGPDLYRVVGAGLGTLFLSWLFGGTLGLLVLLGGRGGDGAPQLPPTHHARAAGADHARAGGRRLLRRRLAPLPGLSPDVAAAQRGRTRVGEVQDVRAFPGLLEGPGRALEARGRGPASTPRSSSRSTPSGPTRAPARRRRGPITRSTSSSATARTPGRSRRSGWPTAWSRGRTGCGT